MTVDYLTEIKIGTTYGNMVYIETLNDLSGFPFPPPYVRFYDYQEVVTNLDGSRRAIGLPHFSLTWGDITQEQRDLLQETYCTDSLQSVVYMQVPTNNNAGQYKVYRCFFNWPDEGEVTRENDLLQNLVVECTEAIYQAPPD